MAAAASRSGSKRLLHAHAEGRKQDGALHALFIHQREPRVAVAVCGTDRLELAEQRVQVRAFRVAAAEVLVERAGLTHGVERRVRDEAVHPAADEQPLPAVELSPLDGALPVLRLDVSGERVDGLVVVVVAVEVLEGKLCHRGDVLSRAGCLSSTCAAARGSSMR